MNIINLSSPKMREEYGSSLKDLFEHHGGEDDPIDMERVSALAESQDNVLLALTDSRGRIIAFGHRVLDDRQKPALARVLTVIVAPDHGQSSNILETVVRNLDKLVVEREHSN